MKYPRLKFAVLFLFAGATHLFAQDTIPARADTAAPPVFADSVRPILQFPQHVRPEANGFSDGVWEWDRESFLLEAAVTIGDLLERLPSVLTFRTGLYVQPEAASPVGGTANRVEVWLDGYALDPMLESSFDISKLELSNVQRVRVERRLGRVRIHIETLAAKDTRAYSMVEAGVGQPDANMFRGVFLAPKLFFGPLSLAIDRIDTDGSRGVEPADQFAGWAKWAFIRKTFGIQAQYRRMSTDRDPEVPWPSKYKRGDLIVSARAMPFNGLVTEVFAGRTKIEQDTVTTTADNDSIPLVEEETTQLGARATFNSRFFWADGSFRLRSAEQLPSSQLDAAAGIRYGPFSAAAEIVQSDWRDAGSTSELTLRAEAGPFAGFRVFGETTTSDRGISYLTGLPDSTAAVITSYDGYRAGAEFQWRGLVAAGALLNAKTDSVRTFGLPFDRRAHSFAGGDVKGWEVSGRVPLPLIHGLFAEGSITNWYNGNVWLYLPTRMYRAGVELHAIPLKSGNLEILGRVEAIYRGIMLAPNPLTGEGQPEVIQTPAYNTVDGYLQIRIMDVRAFMRYEDLTGQDAADFPGRPIQAPRIFYGVKWQFFN